MTMRIFVPDETVACSLGADAVADVVAKSIDGRLDAQLVRNGSRGLFYLEPLVEVETEGRRYGFANLDATAARDLFAVGLPSISDERCIGPVDDVPYLARQTRLTFARAGLTQPLSMDDYVAHGGWRGLGRALQLSPQQIVDEVRVSGLRGRGGAAFPAGIKWQTVLDAPGQTKHVVCNADEGDSGTFADRLLMECDPYQLIEGMAIAGIAVGAQRGVIYLRSEYPKAHVVLTEAIARAREGGFLGSGICGSDVVFDIEVRLGAGAYICGEETAMLESIEGKRGMIRAKPPLPALSGLHGQPTVVNNVLTLAAATTIMADGGEAYASFGTSDSAGTMPFQLAGNVARGGLVEVPFGVPLTRLVDEFAGGSASGRPLKALQLGGPLGGYLTPADGDVALDYASVAARGSMIGHGGVVCYDDGTDMAAMAEFAMHFCAIESCGKCTPCRVGSTRARELIGHVRDGDSVQQNLALLEELMETMELGSLCALGGLAPMPVRSLLRLFPEEFTVRAQPVTLIDGRDE